MNAISRDRCEAICHTTSSGKAPAVAYRWVRSSWIGWPLLIVLSGVLSACAGHDTQADTADSLACQPIDDAGVDRLFDQWNAALKSGSADAVVNLYAERSILLPTQSRRNRISREAKIDYFEHFQAKHPSGSIDTSMKFIGCNIAINAGNYTFRFPLPAPDDVLPARYTYTYGWDRARHQWLITSHHSSEVPKGE